MKIARKTINFKTIVALIIWTAVAGASQIYLTEYAARPGLAANPPASVVPDDLHKTARNLPTLLVFAHPQCPCTRATMRELEQLVAHTEGKVEIHVFFLQPANEPRQWVESDLWRQASKIPDVQVSTINEKELERFGDVTSGQTMLYDATGNLIFSGGITEGRGHEGDNTGRSAIESYLREGQITLQQTPVFGCALTASEKKL